MPIRQTEEQQVSLETEYDVPRPTEIPHVDAKPDWPAAFKRAAAKFSRDQGTDIAAMLTYYGLFSLFPAIAAIVSLVSLLVEPATIINILADLTGKAPTDAAFNTPRDIIDRFAGSSGAGFALVIGVLTALWSASGYVGGFSRAMNRVYGVEEGRPIFKLRPWLYLVTAIQALLIVTIILAAALSGPVAKSIGNEIGLGEQAVQVWNLAKIPFMAAMVVVIIGLLYWATPNVRKPRRMFFSWGALFALVAWVLATLAFVLYVGLSAGASYQKTFGPFATAALFMFWLWLTNVVILFGAELDAELERTRELKSGLPAEVNIMLPVRDDSGVEKNEEKQAGFIKDARALHLSSDRAIDGHGLPVRDDRKREPRAKRPKVSGAARTEQLKQDVQDNRLDRRDTALSDAAHARKVRARLEAQERKAQEQAKAAEKERQAKAGERAAAVSREEQWESVAQTRAKYEPRSTAAREGVLGVREERRSTFKTERAAKAANPSPPEPKEPKPPMPSPLRDEVADERTSRRRDWFNTHARKPEDVPVVRRRDRKG